LGLEAVFYPTNVTVWITRSDMLLMGQRQVK
jgi:hypothetical protein